MKVRFKRLFRFGLLSFLLFITAICLLLGWKVERAKKQREAVAWLNQHQLLVMYDYEVDDQGLYL